MLGIFFVNVIFITLQKKSFSIIFFLIPYISKVPFCQNWKIANMALLNLCMKFFFQLIDYEPFFHINSLNYFFIKTWRKNQHPVSLWSKIWAIQLWGLWCQLWTNRQFKTQKFCSWRQKCNRCICEATIAEKAILNRHNVSLVVNKQDLRTMKTAINIFGLSVVLEL